MTTNNDGKPTAFMSIQCGEVCQDDSILLTCPSNLVKLGGSSRYLIETGQVCLKHSCLCDSVGEDTLFFYQITISNPNIKAQIDEIVIIEQGVGKIYSEGSSTFLNRVIPITFTTEHGSDFVEVGKIPHLPSDEGQVIVVQKIAPPNYLHALYTENSIITSSEAFTTNTVEIQPDSVIGRLDGRIQSINGAEITGILDSKVLRSIITAHKGQLTMSANNLRMNGKNASITSPIHTFIPQSSRPSVLRSGSVVYNEKSGNLEFFTGKKWFKLTMEEIDDSK